MSGASDARIEVITAVLLRNQVLWDVTLSLGQWFPTFRKMSLSSTESTRRIAIAGELNWLFSLTACT
jgi:hypothetical protein